MTNEEFRGLCRHYVPQRQIMLKTLESIEKYNDVTIDRKTSNQAKRKMADYQIQIISDNLYNIQSIFEEIEKIHGDKAKDMMWKVYVENQKIEDVAKEYSYAVVTLKKKFAKWKEDVNIT